LAETQGGAARAGGARGAIAAGQGGLPAAGFRGMAAGFQRDLQPFLASQSGALSGLSIPDSPDKLIAGVAEGRLDYVLISDPEDPAGLLKALSAAARRPALGVLLVRSSDDGPCLPEGVVADYLSSDASQFEVVLTVRALMRRCRPQAMVGQTAYGDLLLDEGSLRFAIRGHAVSLNLEVFGVFGAMMDDPERVWERDRLHALVFGRGSRNDIRAIDMRISRARRHVTRALGLDPIRTVRGVGYALVPGP
jgi:hypothetical protein